VTYRETTLQYLRPGQAVNLEGDVLGKYVEKFMGGKGEPAVEDRLSLEFLAEHGY
jgi:riboflavin synthase